MASQSTHQKIIDAAVPIIRALEPKSPQGVLLPVFNKRLVDFQRIEVYPCILVMAAGTESADGGTTGKDDIGYPVAVALIDRAAPEDDTLADLWLYWRQLIRNAFINQRKVSASVASVYNCRWEPGAIIEVKALEYQKVLGSMLLRFMSRETRG